MFVKIEGSLINLDLVCTIDLNDDWSATLWFTGTENAYRDVTADDMKVIEEAIRHEYEYAFEEIEAPVPRSRTDMWKGYRSSKRGTRKPRKTGGR